MDIYNYKMMIPMQYDGIGRALYVYRSRELDHKWILENELLPGNIVLDLGANIGYYAIMEAKVGKSGKIYGIEPDPRNIEFLIKILILMKLMKFLNLNKEQFLTKMVKQNSFYLLKLI